MSESGQVNQDGTTNTTREALETWRQTALDMHDDDRKNPSGHDVKLSVQAGLMLCKQAERDSRLLIKNLPELFKPTSISELRSLSLALQAAEIEWQQVSLVPKNKDITPVVARARKTRDILLKYSDELWPDHTEVNRELARIREGRGHLDLSQDCLALYNLYNKYQSDMDPDTKNDFNYARYVAEADQVGNELLHLLAETNSSKELVRNGIWTLFQKQYNHLQDCGSFVARQLNLSDPGYDDRYPPLGRVSRSPQRTSSPTQDTSTEPGKLPWEK